jgi:hypothetical protein
MTAVPEDAQEFLGSLETAEAALLGWGLTGGFFASQELEGRADAFLESLTARNQRSNFSTGWELVEALMDAHLLWKLPNGDRYRTLMAEGVRLLSTLRQTFPDPPQYVAWRAAPSLVADYRFLTRRRLYPRRDSSAAPLIEGLRSTGTLTPAREAAITAVLTSDGEMRGLAGFQVRATRRLLGDGSTDSQRGTVISAGTGSGKTLAFYLPAFAHLADLVGSDPWTKVLAIYPRNELLKDQLREAVATARRLRSGLQSHGKRGLTIAALYGDVPWNAKAVVEDGKWPRVQFVGAEAFTCPFLRCPNCGFSLVWRRTDIDANVERLICVRPACAGRVEGDEVPLTRARMLDNPPDILFTSTEMLNQRLASPRYGRLLGIGVRAERRPKFVLLDEVHSYEGVHGAHVGLLLRRWRRASNAQPHFVGLSATLADAPRFFAELVGLGPGSVSEVAPLPEEMVAGDAEYHVALRGDPSTGTSLLSTTIQASMLLRRLLSPRAGHSCLGSRLFVFTDDLDVTNRLYFNVLDAEGWDSFGRPKPQAVGSLANLRSHLLPDAAARLEVGQNWQAVEDAGHLLPVGGTRVRVGRTSSQDTGVSADADVIVATASLEVGVDDPEVGAVLQHKTPHSSAQFLQRKGRAGRRRGMRPWTAVVLSDFGRDRATYQNYDQLFSPTLPPRFLPLSNRAVLRMQANLLLLEWVARRSSTVSAGEPWSDFSEPGRDPATRARQQLHLQHLRALLENDTVRTEFAEHVKRALHLGEPETRAILWSGPRSVIMEAAPTMLRRLERAWRRFDGSPEPSASWKPLPEFIPSSLFADLLLPEIDVRLPALGGIPARVESMPLAQALREFAPGRVSRRFGIVHGFERYWIDPGATLDVSIDSFCPAQDRQLLGRFHFIADGRLQDVPVYRPSAIATTVCPPNVQQSSNSFLLWRSEFVVPGDGSLTDLPTPSAWDGFLRGIRYYTHHTATPVEVRRFAVGARATVGRGRARPTEQVLRFVEIAASGASEAIGIGFVADVDALEILVTYPSDLHRMCAADSRLLRSMRASRFRELVRTSTDLDGVANVFQRDSLAQVYLSAIVTEALRTGAPLVDVEPAIWSDINAPVLRQVLDTFFQWNDAAPPGNPPPAAGAVPRRLDELADLLLDPVCRRVLHEAAAVLWSAIDDAWEPWLRRRFAATLAAAFVEAAHALCPRMEADALVVDLAPVRMPAHSEQTNDETASIWLSETTIGGGGFIEEFLNRYAMDPRYFVRLLDSAVAPSDLEQMGDDLRRVLDYATDRERPDAELVASFFDLREANSYAEISNAVGRLRRRLSALGTNPTSTLLVALNARVLHPGTSAATDAFLAQLVRDWREAEEQLGVDVDARVFALARSTDVALEQALSLALPSDPASQAATSWRYGVLSGMLWPRGAQIRAQTFRLTNRYEPSEECDRLLVEVAVGRQRPRIDLSSETWFEQLAREIVEHGTAELMTDVTNATGLATAVRRLAEEPIDSEILLTHARLVGFRRDGGALIAEFDLPEAFQ